MSSILNVHSDKKNVESMRKIHAQLVELAIKVFHLTRNVFQAILYNLDIQLELTLQANK